MVSYLANIYKFYKYKNIYNIFIQIAIFFLIKAEFFMIFSQ